MHYRCSKLFSSFIPVGKLVYKYTSLLFHSLSQLHKVTFSEIKCEFAYTQHFWRYSVHYKVEV